MVAQTQRISFASGLDMDTTMSCARHERPAWSEPSPKAPGSRRSSLDDGDRLDLDERARRELRDLDRRACRRRRSDVLRVHLVHAREVVEALEEDGRLDELVERASRRLEDRAQVLEDLLGLC